MPHVLYWFDPADDHHESSAEWHRRAAAPIRAVAAALDWSSAALIDSPCVWIRAGTINHARPYMNADRTMAECVAFDIPAAVLPAARKALDETASTWKLDVTDSRPEVLMALPVQSALVHGVFVLINAVGPAVGEWRELLNMPVIARDDEYEDLLFLAHVAGAPRAYPSMIALLARSLRRAHEAMAPALDSPRRG